MLQLQIATSPQRDIPPDISDQIPPEVAEGASQTGKSSVAILKIAECSQSDFLYWLEQRDLPASFSTTSCRGSIAAVGVVLIPNLLTYVALQPIFG
jgi:hypothetical protein